MKEVTMPSIGADDTGDDVTLGEQNQGPDGTTLLLQPFDANKFDKFVLRVLPDSSSFTGLTGVSGVDATGIGSPANDGAGVAATGVNCPGVDAMAIGNVKAFPGVRATSEMGNGVEGTAKSPTNFGVVGT